MYYPNHFFAQCSLQILPVQPASGVSACCRSCRVAATFPSKALFFSLSSSLILSTQCKRFQLKQKIEKCSHFSILDTIKDIGANPRWPMPAAYQAQESPPPKCVPVTSQFCPPPVPLSPSAPPFPVPPPALAYLHQLPLTTLSICMCTKWQSFPYPWSSVLGRVGNESLRLSPSQVTSHHHLRLWWFDLWKLITLDSNCSLLKGCAPLWSASLKVLQLQGLSARPAEPPLKLQTPSKNNECPFKLIGRCNQKHLPASFKDSMLLRNPCHFRELYKASRAPQRLKAPSKRDLKPDRSPWNWCSDTSVCVCLPVSRVAICFFKSCSRYCERW